MRGRRLPTNSAAAARENHGGGRGHRQLAVRGHGRRALQEQRLGRERPERRQAQGGRRGGRTGHRGEQVAAATAEAASRIASSSGATPSCQAGSQVRKAV